MISRSRWRARHKVKTDRGFSSTASLAVLWSWATTGGGRRRSNSCGVSQRRAVIDPEKKLARPRARRATLSTPTASNGKRQDAVHQQVITQFSAKKFLVWSPMWSEETHTSIANRPATGVFLFHFMPAQIIKVIAIFKCIFVDFVHWNNPF